MLLLLLLLSSPDGVWFDPLELVVKIPLPLPLTIVVVLFDWSPLRKGSTQVGYLSFSELHRVRLHEASSAAGSATGAMTGKDLPPKMRSIMVWMSVPGSPGSRSCNVMTAGSFPSTRSPASN